MDCKNVAKFLKKLFVLLDNSEYWESISWDCTGENIQIKNQQRLQTEIIPKHFSLKKFSSFVRQLHLYDFHKIKSKNNLIFANSLFLREHPYQQLAAQIVRKRKTKANMQLAKKIVSQKTVDPELSLNLASPQMELPKIKQEMKIRSFRSMSSIRFKSYDQLDRIEGEDIFDIL